MMAKKSRKRDIDQIITATPVEDAILLLLKVPESDVFTLQKEQEGNERSEL